MRTLRNTTWAKMVLACTAALVIGGPGLVLADGGCPDYLTPRSARLLGPGAVPVGSTNTYSLQVFFADGSSATNPEGTAFSKTASLSGGDGTISATSGEFTATSTGAVVLKGRFSNSCGIVEATRRVRITSPDS